MSRNLSNYLLSVTAGVVITILTSGQAAAQPRGNFLRGAGDASWDSRFDWNPNGGSSNPRGNFTRGGAGDSWDSRFDWDTSGRPRNPRGNFLRGAGDASWDSRFDWNP